MSRVEARYASAEGPGGKTLLVGGPFDNKMVDIPDSPPELTLAHFEKGEPFPKDSDQRAHRYLRVFASEKMSLYRHESMSEEEALKVAARRRKGVQ
jgi:hypothetical protein